MTAARRVAAWAGMVVVLLTAVVLVVVPASSHAGSRTPSTPATLVPVPPQHLRVTLSDPTARQLSNGRWTPVAKAPINVCGGAAGAWLGHELVVIDARDVCHAAAAFRPSSNTWRKISAPPASLHSNFLNTVVSGSRLIIVGDPDQSAAEWSRHRDRWQTLPRFPGGRLVGPALAAHDGRVIGVASPSHAHSGVAELHDGRWLPMPPLPVEGPSDPAVEAAIVNTASGFLGGRLYVLAAVEWNTTKPKHPRALAPGAVTRLRLLRMDHHHWTALPLPRIPLTLHSHSLQDYRGRLVASGFWGCSSESCNYPRTRAVVIGANGRDAMATSDPGLWSYADFDDVFTGRAVIAYTENDGDFGGDTQPTPRADAIYDLSTGQWLPAPPKPIAMDVTTAAWSSQGLVLIGDTASGRGSGLMLRPREP